MEKGSFDEPLKPFRKAFHLFGSSVALVYLFLIKDKTTFLFCLLPLALFFIVLDVWRLKSEKVNRWVFSFFGVLISERERGRPTGSTFYLISSFLSVLFFEREVAVASILFLGLGDPAAAIVGKRFGKVKIRDKTLEGSLAFFIVCFLVASFFFDVRVSLVSALAAAITEIAPLKVDDNLLIPPVSGAVLSLLI